MKHIPGIKKVLQLDSRIQSLDTVDGFILAMTVRYAYVIDKELNIVTKIDLLKLCEN